MTRDRRHHILILGAGSVGRRHARNLQNLGARVACFDPRSDRLDQAREELGPIAVFDDLDRALAEPYNGSVIASPPSFHVDQAIACLERGIPVLLEKPIAPELAPALRLEAAASHHATPVLLGYTYRWWPPLVHLRHQIESRVVGVVRHARFVMSAHLADWHPWERYQDFFMASKDLGGGALLDESHFLDLMHWFFGMPESVAGNVEHLSNLEITTDDNVDLIVRYGDGFRVTLHLDLFGRPHEKSITVVGEEGTLQCRFDPHVVVESVTGKETVTTQFSCERNDMFLAEAKEFVEVIEGRRQFTCSVADGVAVLRIVEAARRSSEERRTVEIGAA